LKLELKNPENAPPPAGKYSNLAVVPEGSKLLFIAGQIGNLKSGEILKGLEAQYDQALRNINSIIESIIILAVYYLNLGSTNKPLIILKKVKS